MRLIYADEFVARLHAHGVGVDPETRETLISVADIQRILLEVPTVEPKRGRWIKRDAWMPGSELETKYFPFQDCSECGWSYRIKILSEFKFCPNCGADMRERSETDG